MIESVASTCLPFSEFMGLGRNRITDRLGVHLLETLQVPLKKIAMFYPYNK